MAERRQSPLQNKRRLESVIDYDDEEREQKSGPLFFQIMEEKISSMLKEACSLHESGDSQRAVAKLTRAIALQPRNPDLFRLRAEAYFSLKEYHSSIINFQKVVALKPSVEVEITERLACVHFEYGAWLYDSGKFARSLEMFEKTSEYQPENREPVMRRIACLLSLQRYNECLDMINKELESDDSNPDLYVFRAQLNGLFGNMTQHYYDLCSALEIDGTHKEALRMKTELEERAVDCKNQAIHNSLVGRKKDALKKITTAIDTDPAVAEYHILRGALYRRLGDFNAAVDDYLVAMDKCNHRQDCEVYKSASRHLVLTYNDFAMECFKQRYFGEAVTLLNKAISEEKSEKGLYLNRGDCFYRMNNSHFALADYQQALELDPSNWDVSCRIAVVCCELGIEQFAKAAYEKTEKLFTTALQYNPKVSRFYLCRARARNELKNMSGVKDDITAALLLHPSCEECQSLIARVFPGKSARELILSNEALKVREKLDSEMARIAKHFASQPNKGSSSAPITKVASQYLAGIELKVSEQDESEQKFETSKSESGGLTCALNTKKSATSAASHHSSAKSHESLFDTNFIDKREARDDVKNVTLPDEGEKEPDHALSPRQWSVLDCSLPPLTSDPQGILPTLTACLKEDHFHRQIYYSKKACTEEVQRVLRSPPEHYGIADRPPKIQIAHDVVFGGRTIATASSLLKTVNK